jgi:hypothetical protein
MRALTGIGLHPLFGGVDLFARRTARLDRSVRTVARASSRQRIGLFQLSGLGSTEPNSGVKD